MECLEKHTVGIYIKKYIDNGLKGLEMKYSPGKKRKLSKEQEIELVNTITTHTPEEVGFKNRCNWTIALVQEYIKIDCQYKCNTLCLCCSKYLCRCFVSKTLARSIIYYIYNNIKFFLSYCSKVKFFRIKLS